MTWTPVTTGTQLKDLFADETGGVADQYFGAYAFATFPNGELAALLGCRPADKDGALLVSVDAAHDLYTRAKLDEQGGNTMATRGEWLYIPGVDAVEPSNEWDWGNLYRYHRGDKVLEKHRIVPKAIHVWCQTWDDNGAWMVGTGAWNTNTNDYVGDVFLVRSDYSGCTFHSRLPEERCYEIAWFAGALYAAGGATGTPYGTIYRYADGQWTALEATRSYAMTRPRALRWRDRLFFVCWPGASLFSVDSQGRVERWSLPFTLNVADYQANVLTAYHGVVYALTINGVYVSDDLRSWSLVDAISNTSAIGVWESPELGAQLVVSTRGDNAALWRQPMPKKRMTGLPALPDGQFLQPSDVVAVDGPGYPSAYGVTLAQLAQNVAGPLQTNPTGGAARGQGAVDLQIVRVGAHRVAAGNGSVVLGGDSNYAQGHNSVVGGAGNDAGQYAAVFGVINSASYRSLAFGGGVVAPPNALGQGHGSFALGHGFPGQLQHVRQLLSAHTTSTTAAPLQWEVYEPAPGELAYRPVLRPGHSYFISAVVHGLSAGGAKRAAYQVRALVTAPLGANLLANSSFETFTGTKDDNATDTFASWTNLGTDGSNRLEAVNYRAACYGAATTTGLKVVRSGGTPRIVQTVSVSAGTVYYLVGYAMGDGNTPARVRVLNASAGDTPILAINVGTPLSGRPFFGVWHPWHAAFKAPSGCTSVKVELSAGSDGVVYFDGLHLATATPAVEAASVTTVHETDTAWNVTVGTEVDSNNGTIYLNLNVQGGNEHVRWLGMVEYTEIGFPNLP